MKILVVKLADYGDLLLSEPAIRSLRLSYPDARINVLTTPHAAGLLRHIDREATAIPFEKSAFDVPGNGMAAAGWDAAMLGRRLRAARYDRVAILHHLVTRCGSAKYQALALATGARFVAGLDNGRGDFLTHPVLDRGFGFKHESEYMLDVARAAGGAETSSEPRFEIEEEPLPFGLPDSFIALAPTAGAFSTARIWSFERFAEVSRRLTEHGRAIVIVGGDDARQIGEFIVEQTGSNRGFNLAGRTSLNQLAIVLQRAGAVIGNDSFPAHLAAAVGTRVVAIFGPSNADAWRPRSPRSTVVSLHLPCSPCLYTGYRLGRREGCPARTCLDRITPDMVLESTMELLRA